MSTTNKKGRAIIVRPAGFDDDYQAAQKAELLEPEDPITEAQIRGDEGIAHRFRERGVVTKVTRMPHASYILGSQNILIIRDIELLTKKYSETPDLMSEADLARLRLLNEVSTRNLREEREQVKLQRFEDMEEAELKKLLEEELKALEAEE